MPAGPWLGHAGHHARGLGWLRPAGPRHHALAQGTDLRRGVPRARAPVRSRILARHILPNALPLLLVAGSLRVGGFILLEAALSFLGLGVQPPTATWGSMISLNRALHQFRALDGHLPGPRHQHHRHQLQHPGRLPAGQARSRGCRSRPCIPSAQKNPWVRTSCRTRITSAGSWTPPASRNEDQVLEIGPGLGHLTRRLADRAGQAARPGAG